MTTIVIVIGIALFIWIGFVVTYQGLNLRKLSNWFYGVISFACGLLIGLVISNNLIESLKVGIIFAFLTLFTGVTMRQNKQKTEDMFKSLWIEYGNEKNVSFFAQIVRKLLGKYK